MTVLVNAETGYRGYLLSGNPIFLEPYRGVDVSARTAMVTLTGLVAGDTLQREDLSRLSGLVEERLAEMAGNVTRYEAGDRDGAIASVRTATGKRIMDQIRIVGGTLKSEQRAITSNRAAQGAAAARAARRFGIAAGSMVLLLSFLGWALSRTMEQRRQELATETIARLEAERDATISAADLARSESFNRTLLDSSADCIAVLTSGGDVSYLNLAGERQLLRGDADPWQQVAFPSCGPVTATRGRRERLAMNGGEGRFVASHQHPDGLLRW
jgi:CHASE3 domain sensor protein